MIIEVPGEPHDLLNWEKQKAAAIETSLPFYWKLNLGFERPQFPIREELSLAALKLSVEKFTQELLPLKNSEGVIFYQGPLDFSPFFDWTFELEEQYAELLDGVDTSFNRKKFILDCYGNYFQMLSHLVPDDLPVFLLFDPTTSACETLSLFSRPCFEHFQIALKKPLFHRKGWRWEEDKIFFFADSPKKGFLIPDNFEKFSFLDEKSKGYELILESRLNLEWDGLEEIDLPVEKISLRGERMLQGFIAAGGKVNRGRGI